MKLIVVGNCDRDSICKENQEGSDKTRLVLEQDSGEQPDLVLKPSKLQIVYWDMLSCLKDALFGFESQASVEEIMQELGNFKGVTHPRFAYWVTYSVEFASLYTKGSVKSAVFTKACVDVRRVDTIGGDHRSSRVQRMSIGSKASDPNGLLEGVSTLEERSTCNKILRSSTASVYQEGSPNWAFAYLVDNQMLTANYTKLAVFLKEGRFLESLYNNMKETSRMRKIYSSAFSR